MHNILLPNILLIYIESLAFNISKLANNNVILVDIAKPIANGDQLVAKYIKENIKIQINVTILFHNILFDLTLLS